MWPRQAGRPTTGAISALSLSHVEDSCKEPCTYGRHQPPYSGNVFIQLCMKSLRVRECASEKEGKTKKKEKGRIQVCGYSGPGKSKLGALVGRNDISSPATNNIRVGDEPKVRIQAFAGFQRLAEVGFVGEGDMAQQHTVVLAENAGMGRDVSSLLSLLAQLIPK